MVERTPGIQNLTQKDLGFTPNLPEEMNLGKPDMLDKRAASHLFDVCTQSPHQINCHFGGQTVIVIKPYELMDGSQRAKDISVQTMMAAPKIRLVANSKTYHYAQD